MSNSPSTRAVVVPMTGGMPILYPSLHPRDEAIFLSGVAAGIAASALFGWFGRKSPPLVVYDETVSFNINEIERDTFYEFVDDEGKKALRVTAEGMLETYDVEES